MQFAQAMKIINRRELNKKHRFSRTSNTPATKLMREIAIMKKLDHPNVVNLLQVIDDPKNQMLYMSACRYVVF
jgi:[calcium/calmodulin-dependent protein kinase] kinase